MTLYHLTPEQLSDLLHTTLDLFFEYRDLGEESEDSARWSAVRGAVEGLDADRETAAEAGRKPYLQAPGDGDA